MESAFWEERWARNEIGFHRNDVHPMLEEHWAELAPASEETVLVPLCGKSLDLAWLADHRSFGHDVVGVELSERAVRAFFDERGLEPERVRFGGLDGLRAGNVTLCIGDVFAFEPPEPFSLIYDRAAMIALPPETRARYRAKLRALSTGQARGLLITLDYAQAEMNGPPFSVPEDELHDDPLFDYQVLDRRDALDGHPPLRDRGLSQLTECAIRMRPNGG